MALVPATTFTMGSVHKEPESFREEAAEYAQQMDPAHKVKLDAYCIDLVQVTQARYAACIAAGICSVPKWQNDPHFAAAPTTHPDCHWQDAARSEAPVTCVTAAQAERYCNWVGRRLPTETEWEHAARGNDDRLYPWGDRPAPDDYSGKVPPPVCKTASQIDFCAVGSAPKGKSPFGLLDMVGSAADWTSSDFCTYPDHSCKDPERKRISRGGRGYYWITFRRVNETDRADPTTGFRCAAAPLEPDQM